MKMTYQPSNVKRARKYGFRSKMSTKNGRLILKRRRLKGRKRLAISVWFMNLILSFAFKKNEKIKNKKDFDNIFQNGKLIKTKFYSCRYLKNNGNKSRIGIIIRKKIRRI